MKQRREVDGDRLLFYAFALAGIYFVLFFTGVIDTLGSYSIYLALLLCLAIGGLALGLSVRLFLPGSGCKSIMRYSALLISVGLLVFTAYAFFVPSGSVAPPIPWFYHG